MPRLVPLAPFNRLPKPARWAIVIGVPLLVLTLVVTLGFRWLVHRPLPQLDGRIEIAGLEGEVTVYRDAWGIPQIYAADPDDLFRAQGYVHAQDRFWEMDFRRHLTAGRLSELFGSDQVDADAFIRTLGWRRVAEQEWTLLSPDTKRYLQDYAEGVNAYLADHQGSRASLEYALLWTQHRGYKPEPWSPIDSLAWLKAMAWDLRTNMEDEIGRSLAAATLPKKRVDQLYPAYPYERNLPIVRTGRVVDGRFVTQGAGDGTSLDPPVNTPPSPDSARPAPSTAAPPDGAERSGAAEPSAGAEPSSAVLDATRDAQPALARAAASIDALPSLLGKGAGIGSNSWVVSGVRTSTGKPMLANDPHLSPSIPSVWYQAGLHCTHPGKACPFDVTGFTFSGVPGVIIGHNARIAWGFTNLGADVSDLYLERIRGSRYEYAGKLRPLITRQEKIKVAGGDDVTITVRSTRHGPIVSDAPGDSDTVEDLRDVGKFAPAPDTPGDRGEGYAVALRWTALDPGKTADAISLLNTASNWADFRTAARSLAVPAENLIYADVDGNIGYQAPGRIPIRAKGDGRWPVPGWSADYDWRGFIPFDALPNVYNPVSGFIVTANNAVAPASYPYLLTNDWSYGYRSSRIEELIKDGGTLDPQAMLRIQRDTYNGMAPVLVPRLLKVRVDGWTADGQRLLRGWDYTQPPDSGAAAYYNAVWRNLLIRTFDDEIPEGFARPDGSDRWFEVVRPLLDRPTDRWWDDVRTKNKRETRDDILRAAMTDARNELTRLSGKDSSTWSWGRIHTLTLENQSFGQSGIGVIAGLFNRGPLHLGGGESIVDATAWNADEGYEVTAVPSMRMVIDLADLDRSRWINLTGASGHTSSPNYWDQAKLWRDGETLAMHWRRDSIERDAKHMLTLAPQI